MENLDIKITDIGNVGFNGEPREISMPELDVKVGDVTIQSKTPVLEVKLDDIQTSIDTETDPVVETPSIAIPFDIIQVGGATDSIQRTKLSQAEYDAMLRNGQIEHDRWYMIYRDQAKTFLMRIYIGRLLFATRGDKLSTGFPYVFPIVFI